MSFHPEMSYDAAFHKSARALEDEGPPFAYTPEHRARFEEIVKRYPPERRRSGGYRFAISSNRARFSGVNSNAGPSSSSARADLWKAAS